MSDGHAAEAACDEPCRPSERDMMHVPKPPELCCKHEEAIGVIYNLIHAWQGRELTLESLSDTLQSRLDALESRVKALEADRGTT
jgi:hypothetical protein